MSCIDHIFVNKRATQLTSNSRVAPVAVDTDHSMLILTIQAPPRRCRRLGLPGLSVEQALPPRNLTTIGQ